MQVGAKARVRSFVARVVVWHGVARIEQQRVPMAAQIIEQEQQRGKRGCGVLGRRKRHRRAHDLDDLIGLVTQQCEVFVLKQARGSHGAITIPGPGESRKPRTKHGHVRVDGCRTLAASRSTAFTAWQRLYGNPAPNHVAPPSSIFTTPSAPGEQKRCESRSSCARRWSIHGKRPSALGVVASRTSTTAHERSS